MNINNKGLLSKSLRCISTLVFLILCNYLSAQVNTGELILGQWQTHDNQAVIEIYKEEEKFFGKIVELNADAQSEESMIGLVILNDFTFSKHKYKHGTLYDPISNSLFNAKLWLKDKNTLKVRDYCGVLFKTFTWKRIKG